MATKTYTVTQVKAYNAGFQNPPTILSVSVQELDDKGNIIKAGAFNYQLSTDEITNLEILMENAMAEYEGTNGFV